MRGQACLAGDDSRGESWIPATSASRSARPPASAWSSASAPGFLVLGEFPPSSAVASLTRQLRDEYTVSLRAIIGYVFEYRRAAAGQLDI